MDRVPPPEIHMHIRCFDVASDVPLGNKTASKPLVLSDKNTTAGEVDITDSEKDKFEEWLRSVWLQKDIIMTKFLETGSFIDDPKMEVVIPLELRSKYEVLDSYMFFLPSLLGWFADKFRV